MILWDFKILCREIHAPTEVIEQFTYWDNWEGDQKARKGYNRYIVIRGGGGDSICPWEGRCGTAPHTLTLFKTCRACSSWCCGLSSVVYHGWEGKCSEILATPSYSKNPRVKIYDDDMIYEDKYP